MTDHFTACAVECVCVCVCLTMFTAVLYFEQHEH